MNIGTLWAQIGLDNRQLQTGARESERTLTSLSNKMDKDLPRSSGVASKALGALGTAFSAYYLVQQVTDGIQAIDELHLSVVKMASTITTMQGPKNIEQNYAAAKKYAEGLAVALQKVDEISFANNEGLQAMAETMIMQGVIIDTNNKAQMESFAALSNMIAMQTAGQNQALQTRQEMRALLSGEARTGAVVAQQIDQMAKNQGEYKNGLKDIVRLGKEHGDFWQRIEPYMQGVKAAADDISNSWEAVTSSWETAKTMIKREVFTEVYASAIANGKMFVDWIKANSKEIAQAIKIAMDVMILAAKVALAYFAVFVAGPAILGAVATAVGILQVQMALASMEMAGTTAVARIYALVMGRDVVTATWAAAGAMGKLKMIGQVLLAFFIGWEIGKIIEKHCAVARQAAAALVAGLHKVWATLVFGSKLVGTIMATTMTGNFKQGIDVAKQQYQDFQNELKRIDVIGFQQFQEAGRDKTGVPAVAGDLAIPKLPTTKTGVDAKNVQALKNVQQEAEAAARIRQSLLDDRAQNTMNEVDLIKWQTEQNIQQWEKEAKTNKVLASQMTENKILAYENMNDKIDKIEKEAMSSAFKKLEENLKPIVTPLQEVNSALDQEISLLGFLGDEQEIENRLMQIRNQLLSQGRALLLDEETSLREKLALSQKLNEENRIMNSLMRESRGGRNKEFTNVLGGIDKLVKDPTSGFSQTDATLAGVEAAGLGDKFAKTADGYSIQLEQLEEYYDRVDELRQQNLISEEAANQMRLELDYEANAQRLQFAGEFFGNLATLSSSKNKELAAIGKAAAITQASIDGVLAVQKALATYSPPYNYIMATAVGITAAANVAKIAGFEAGGYTGNIGRQDVAGVVHGQEFVINAQATARNRPALEAINSGEVLGGGGYNITIENYGTSKMFEVQQLSERDVRIIARDEVQKQAPKVIANEISNPNSTVSKSIDRNTKTQRKRAA